MLLSEAFENYRGVIHYLNQSPKTEEHHLITKRALIAFFGDIPIESLTAQMIRQWKVELDKSRGDDTVRSYIVKLRVVLKHIRNEGVDCIDPDRVAIPKRKDKVPVFLNKVQVAQCIKATKRIKNKAIISLLYASGIRVSELCSLNRGDVHEKSFTIVGKGGKARLCFIDERTERLLKLYNQSRDDNLTPLFLTDAGKRITPGVIQETFKTVRKQTGLMCHPHTLRHSFATNLLQSNTNLYYVSKMLGHAQLTTTQQYLHTVDADLQKVYTEHHTV